MWRRFRSLPGPLQAAVGVVVLAAYTAGVLALVVGGDDDSEKPRPLSPVEQDVKENVERGRVPQRDETDVPQFRAARVSSARCEEKSCTVTYTVAVPGRGRIFVQQADIVRRVFGETDVDRLVLELGRGQPTGPDATPKSAEETPLGVPLFETTCERKRAPDDVDWSDERSGGAIFIRICRVREIFEAAGEAGGVGGGE